MARELLWNENYNHVYGWASDFKDKEEFEKAVEADYEDGSCRVSDIEKRLCITTEKGIEPETLCPVELTDIEMEWYYIASVEPIDECSECGSYPCMCAND